MDRELNRLQDLDWDRIESADRVAGRVSEVLSSPGPLRELVDNAMADPELLELSECQWWGDRIVLFDDPDGLLRIRLHRFDAGTHFPHSHRWPFHTKILRGSYVHRLYGPEDYSRSLIAAGGELRASTVRVESAGASYVIDQHMVHSVTPSTNTFSLVIQGPRLKAQSLRTAQDGSLIWKGGRASESEAQVDDARMPKERLAEVREIALRTGLLDR